MKYVATALLSLIAGGSVGWYVTTTDHRLSELDSQLKFMVQMLQQSRGRTP